MINAMCEEASQTAREKGWYDSNTSRVELLALIHSEVSEALEADRNGNYVNFKEELADICIRVFSLCGVEGIDLHKEIIKKMAKNKRRPYRHGGKLY